MRILERIGIDAWYRPVYRDQDGQLWKDVTLGQLMPDLHSATGNEFEGEPGYPLEGDYIIQDETARL